MPVPPLDLDAYLARLGVARAQVAVPDVAALRLLHRAHVDAVPFAGAHTALGRVPALDLATVARRLVDEGRGGYCLEHVTLFAAALSALGFRPQVRLHGVGQLGADGPPDTHLTVLARPADDARRWIADVGFGVGVLGPAPLPSAEDAAREASPAPRTAPPGDLLAGEPVRHGAWEHRAARTPDGRVVLQERRAGAWVTLHHGADRTPDRAAIEAANRWVAQDPRSPFAGRLVAMRTTDARRERLVGTRLELTPAGGAARTAELTPQEAVTQLEVRFRVRLDADDRRALVERLAERPVPAAA